MGFKVNGLKAKVSSFYVNGLTDYGLALSEGPDKVHSSGSKET